jgi:MFS family permease
VYDSSADHGGSSEAAPAKIVSPSRAFWQFWTASTISACGSGVTAVAMPVIALTVLDASEFEVGLLAATSFAAWLFIGLPAGVIVQRYSLRAIQVSMDAVRALTIASVPVAYAMDTLTLTQLVVVALIMNFADVVFAVGSSTFLPQIIPKADLLRRNSITSGTQSVLQFGAPALGGLLLATIGPILSLLVDSVSYAMSSALLQGLPDPGRTARTVGGRVIADIREGVAFVWRDPVMRPCLVGAALLNCGLGGLIALLPLFVIRGADASPALVGVALGAEGIGSLLGAIVVGKLSERFGNARTVLIGLCVATVGALLFPISFGPMAMVVFCIGNLVCALGVAVFGIVVRTHRQMVTPVEFLSRVQGTVRFVSWGTVPVGAVVAGALASWLLPINALVFVPVMTLIALLTVAGSAVRAPGSLDYPEAHTSSPPGERHSGAES